ncbi:MAG: hypothetical protein Q8873_00580 [Bacillota bacterium]|nr:hypothetical protein [Bacillota bacterium]
MNIFQKAIKRVRDYMDTVEKERQDQEKIEKWKERLTRAISEHDTFRANCAAWDAQYNSTRAVGSNIQASLPISDRDRVSQTTKDARQVVNLTFQLIESQIDVTVPKPNVEQCEFDDMDEQAETERNDMIEGMLTYMGDRPALERIVSENERITKKNSLCIYKVGYNPNFKAHKYIGTIETTNPHPVNVIPQPGVFKVKDMDYLFHIENRTIDYVCRIYGEEWRDLIDTDGTEHANIDDLSSTVADSTTDRKNNKVSVVECWYKDKDGDVCLLTWINDVIIRDIPKFFYKRDEQGNIIEFDEIEVKPYQITKTDELGNVTVEETNIAKVPAHVPKRFPFVIQYNVPKEKSYYGKADPDIIYDQQEAIKKVLSNHEERLMKGQTKIFVRKGSGLINKLNNSVTQILETDDPNGDIKVVDLKTPDQSLLEYFNVMEQAAKDALGVTEASQGRTDGGANLSGKALETLAANTAGRLGVKAFEKNIAFTELYQLYYDFILAFYDDRRPYRVDGKDGKPMYGYFDKSKLIKQDDAGEWYYPEYSIRISIDSGIPRDKRSIMDFANNSNKLDPVEYWMLADSVGVPMASAILKREQEKESMQQQTATQGSHPVDQYYASLTPEQQQEFQALSQEQQIEIVNRAMGGDINA